MPFTGSREEPDLLAALLARVRRGAHQRELNFALLLSLDTGLLLLWFAAKKWSIDVEILLVLALKALAVKVH